MIEQAIYGTEGPAGYRFLARSPGFQDEWLAEAERLCMGFGERVPGSALSGCVFALPFADQCVAVVQAAELGQDDSGRPGALRFRLLILPVGLYQASGGDPFQIADAFPPPWQVSDSLPVLEWPGPFQPAERTIEQVQKVLDVPNSATLLGGVQVLVDGGRLVFERTSPDPHLVRGLWALLPTSTRSELWPASFAFSNLHHFHVVVVPRAAGEEFEGYVQEEQAGDYPEGRYELALQIAVEHGRQNDLNELFARRSRAQMFRLALLLLAMFLLVPLIGLALSFLPTHHPPGQQSEPRKPPPPKLPPAGDCPRLNKQERQALAEVLTQLGKRYGLKPPADPSPASLLLALEALDARLVTPPDRRTEERAGRTGLIANTLALPAGGNPLLPAVAVAFGPTGQLREFGPLQRCIRFLLWKQAVPESSDANLNPAELLERLEKKLSADKQGK